MPIKVLAFDGDDTLWDNETHFHLTQTDFRDLLRRHAPDVDVDSRLFATEMANLKLYGYGLESYRRVLDRRGVGTDEFLMVGNSLRSDVVPVVEMGARAVHIPYHLTWDHEHVDEASLPAQGWYRIQSLRELGPLLTSLEPERVA